MNKIDKLEKILRDKISGSEQILSGLNNYLLENINDRAEIKSAVKKIKANLFHFAAVENYISSLDETLKSNNNKVEDFIRKISTNSENKFLRLYKRAEPYLKNIRTVLTLSNSKTLLEIFRLWVKDNRRIDVIVCESRPKHEGRIFAKHLLKENIKVNVITDAMISLYIPHTDAVILGADSILKNGNVINKTGSLAAALLCKYYKKPCYIIASKEKLSNKKRFRQEKQTEDEIWKFRNKNLNITNYYFEEVPKKLITKIISG